MERIKSLLRGTIGFFKVDFSNKSKVTKIFTFVGAGTGGILIALGLFQLIASIVFVILNVFFTNYINIAVFLLWNFFHIYSIVIGSFGIFVNIFQKTYLIIVYVLFLFIGLIFFPIFFLILDLMWWNTVKDLKVNNLPAIIAGVTFALAVPITVIFYIASIIVCIVFIVFLFIDFKKGNNGSSNNIDNSSSINTGVDQEEIGTGDIDVNIPNNDNVDPYGYEYGGEEVQENNENRQSVFEQEQYLSNLNPNPKIQSTNENYKPPKFN